MPTSVGFYRDVLGFKLVAQSQPGDDFDWGLLRLELRGMGLTSRNAFALFPVDGFAGARGARWRAFVVQVDPHWRAG